MSIVAENSLHKSTWPRRLRHRLMVTRQDPTLLVGLCLITLFVWLIAAPLLSIFADIFTVQFGDEARAGADVGGIIPRVTTVRENLD